MISVAPRLHVGNQADYEDTVRVLMDLDREWAVLHCCKEPYHRQALGYTGRGAPKDDPEYLVADRDDRMMLNLVDVDDPLYVRDELVDAAIAFIARKRETGKSVLVHCNQGHSRGPSIALAYMASRGMFPGLSFEAAEQRFIELYPDYAPAFGMRAYLDINWSRLNR